MMNNRLAKTATAYLPKALHSSVIIADFQLFRRTENAHGPLLPGVIHYHITTGVASENRIETFASSKQQRFQHEKTFIYYCCEPLPQAADYHLELSFNR